MHFKNALTVCAVYILTSAWSIELDSAQLIKLNKLFEDHKMSTNEISEKTIAKVVEKTFRTEWKPLLVDFEYEKNQFDSTNLYNLLRALGQGNIKNSKDIKADRLTPFELDFFLEEFDTCLESYEHPKYINFQQLSESFNYWKTMKEALNRKIDEYKIEYGDDHVMNAADFLLIIMEIKPAGLGLTLEQVEMFVSLYEEHKMSDSIHPAASETVFDDIGIAIKPKLKVLFESGQPVGTLLVDLMSVAAEQNRAVRKNELRLSLCEVITAIKEFIEIDVDDNGVLSPAEYANFVEMANILLGKSAETNEKVKYYLMKFDGINSTSAAEYMVVVFFMDIEYSQDRLETTQL